MPVIEISSEEQFLQYYNVNNYRLIILDCYATWCRPCVAIAPVFLKMSEKYEDILFLKFDTDIDRAFTDKLGIQSLPTFVFFKGPLRTEINGAREDEIIKMIDRMNLVSKEDILEWASKQNK